MVDRDMPIASTERTQVFAEWKVDIYTESSILTLEGIADRIKPFSPIEAARFPVRDSGIAGIAGYGQVVFIQQYRNVRFHLSIRGEFNSGIKSTLQLGIAVGCTDKPRLKGRGR